MIAGYRWARRFGFTRREATRTTVTAFFLCRHDPQIFVQGRVIPLARNEYGHPVPEDGPMGIPSRG